CGATPSSMRLAPAPVRSGACSSAANSLSRPSRNQRSTGRLDHDAGAGNEVEQSAELLRLAVVRRKVRGVSWGIDLPYQFQARPREHPINSLGPDFSRPSVLSLCFTFPF